MKALLSTIVASAAVMLAASPGFASDALIPPNGWAPAEFQGSFAPNRLDIYDMRRELAREAEHQRIRTRLGEYRWCQSVATGYPGSPGLVIVCR
jgi:hypothetical protein